MRGRCELHQLAFGPRGCLLCRREADAAASVANVNIAAAGGEHASSGAGRTPAPFGAPATPEQAALASGAPRQISVRLPSSILLLPLVAAGFYFFAFVAGHAPTEASAEPTGEREAAARVADTRPAAAAELAKPAPSFQALVIEEPSVPERRSLEGAEPQREVPPAARAESSKRALQQKRAAEAQQVAIMREHVDVIVYSTSWCPACRSLRGYLAKRGIRATEYDVERNTSAKARQRQLNPRGSVPTVDIEGQVLVGFSPESIENAIDRAARARLERL